ncbi:MAG: glucosyl-dolichyl phosphate glucuronosyltransferase, partial [Blastocatellia bacterium]|nr:glucosyl-dolichyl phosphate glucuronosyltransferase [Blastocatellia bacterium]
MIKISAIICTFKRPDYLRHALRSLCEQSLPGDQYEVIVVDNAVEAEAEQVVKEFDDGRINLRYVTEERVGLSRARNTGLMAAAAPYVAYMDDDARADSQWLEALLGAFEQTSPAPAAVGGRVWLDWQGEKPAWVPERHLSLYTYVDHGAGAHSLENGEYLVGANLAFEKDTLRSIGGFDPNLGRQGLVLLSGEEAAILAQFRQMRKGVYYEPAAVVWHSVDQTRSRPSWLLRRLFWDGASQPLIDAPAHGRSRRSTSLNAYRDLRQCVRWSWEILSAVLKGRKESA